MKIATYEQAVEYIKRFIPYTLYQTEAYQEKELKDPLDRMRYLLTLVDNPEKKFRSVLVGGTSGKGSTSYLISHILTTAGYTTGLTISPHLVRINERMQINDKEISDFDFIALTNTIVPAVERMKESEYGVPSYFEITIAMAFLYFAKKNVDIAIVEVGMGGACDATNTLEPLIAVLTNVSLDHTQFLGDTVEEIAKTKVGIIKQYKNSVPVVVTGVTQPSVIGIVEKQCKKVRARVFRLGKDFSLVEKTGLPGEYQKENLSLALEVVKQLSPFGFTVSKAIQDKALQTAVFLGRFEIQQQEREGKTSIRVLDGAHNQAKMHAFVTSLQNAYPHKKKIFVVAFKKDKNIKDMLQEIILVADTIILTEFHIGTDTMITNASYAAEELQVMLRDLEYKGKVYLEKDSQKAQKFAESLSDATSVIAITGSLYLIGEIKQHAISSV